MNEYGDGDGDGYNGDGDNGDGDNGDGDGHNGDGNNCYCDDGDATSGFFISSFCTKMLISLNRIK